MAYTPYQKGIIKRYYEHGETMALQNLAEIVSDLYLADSNAKKKKLWQKAEAALVKLKVPTVRTARALEAWDTAGLARLLTELQKER